MADWGKMSVALNSSWYLPAAGVALRRPYLGWPGDVRALGSLAFMLGAYVGLSARRYCRANALPQRVRADTAYLKRFLLWSFLLWSWDFLVLCTGVEVESSPKRKIIAGCRVSRFSYLNVLNTFMGVLCFLNLCQKCCMQFCCSCWIVAIFNSTGCEWKWEYGKKYFNVPSHFL